MKISRIRIILTGRTYNLQVTTWRGILSTHFGTIWRDVDLVQLSSLRFSQKVLCYSASSKKNNSETLMNSFFSCRKFGLPLHSVEKREIYFFFWQKFRESNVIIKEITLSLVSRNFYSVRVNFSFSHTVLLVVFQETPYYYHYF